MRQAKVIVDVRQGELLAYAHLVLAVRRDASPDGGHRLADAEVNPLDKGSIDLPAVRGQHLLNGSQRAERHAMAYPDQTAAPIQLHHLPCTRYRTCRSKRWNIDGKRVGKSL